MPLTDDAAFADTLTDDELALLIAALTPPPELQQQERRRRQANDRLTRSAVRWMVRAAEAAAAALLSLLMLFALAFHAPAFDLANDPATDTATSLAAALSSAAAWSQVWEGFLAPPVAVGGLGWVPIPVPVMVAALAQVHATLADPADVTTIMDAAREYDLNPLILFGVMGAEQPWDLRAAYPSRWRAYARNPFDVAVYGAWHPTGYTLAQSAAIAARTIAIRLSAPAPSNENPFAWVDDQANPAGMGVYATGADWWHNVAETAADMAGRIARLGAAGQLSSAVIAGLTGFIVAATSTPAQYAAFVVGLQQHASDLVQWLRAELGKLFSTVRDAVTRVLGPAITGTVDLAATLSGGTITPAQAAEIAASLTAVAAGAIAALAVAAPAAAAA